MMAKTNAPPMSRRATADSIPEVGDRCTTGVAPRFFMTGIIAVDRDRGAEQSRKSGAGAVHFGPR